MGKQLHATSEINATPQPVWQILTDFAAYPDWNPFITRAGGTTRPSERLHLRVQPPCGRGATLRPTVLAADPGRRLRWLGLVEDQAASVASDRGAATAATSPADHRGGGVAGRVVRPVRHYGRGRQRGARGCSGSSLKTTPMAGGVRQQFRGQSHLRSESTPDS